MSGPTGIPTKYKGVWFRSRLEARWAAFFDRARWPWAYEPLELPGWIPDFAILKDYELLASPLETPTVVPTNVLVEVKPALTWPELSLHRARIDRSQFQHGVVLLVGAVVPISVPTLGIGQLKFANDWGPAQLGWCDKACGGRLTILSPTKRCVLCAQGLLGENHRTKATAMAARYFTEAGNDTQWRQST